VTRKEKILAFKRGVFNRVEDYLRGSMCIGFGGHVSETDLSLFNANRDLGLIDSAIRELSEELFIPTKDLEMLKAPRGIKIVGALNDDSSPVGRRHFAFILRYEVSDDPAWDHPTRGEKSVTQLRWLDLESPTFKFREFEYWSQLCLREFFRGSESTQPSYLIRRRRLLQPPHVLCIIGEVGSGKTEATRLLKREFGYRVINSGRVVAKLLKSPPVTEKTRPVFQQRALKFIQQPTGPLILAQAICQEFRPKPASRLLVDGLRHRATLDELRQLVAGKRLGLVFVYTPPDVAFHFFKLRAGKRSSVFDFLKTRDAGVEAEVRKMIEISDAVLYNWTGRLGLRRVLRKFLSELGISKSLGGRK
jgi:predicted NUDIX family phosphoesterase